MERLSVPTQSRFMTQQLLVLGLLVVGVPGSLSARAPILVQAEMPRYPPVAAQARMTGMVQVDFTVRRGIITDMKVTSPSRSGSVVFETMTLRNLKTGGRCFEPPGCSFAPATRTPRYL
jgi:hypothetical protein